MIDLEWDREYALDQTAGDEELLEELLLLFKDSSAADLEQLRRAVAAGDAVGVVRASHSIKGAAATLGLEAIRRLALEMETDGRNDSVHCADKRMEHLAELLGQVASL